MHDDEFAVDAALVRSLVRHRFPGFADVEPVPVSSSGTDNFLFRLGDGLVVRVPRTPAAARLIDLENRWLPVLAARLPVPLPVPVGVGEPSDDFPWPWAVSRWIDGVNPVDDLDDPAGLGRDLARFVAALRRVPVDGGPRGMRSGALSGRDGDVRAAIARLRGDDGVDVSAVSAVSALWDKAMSLPVWDGPDMWAHGDLSPGNVLVRDGRLAAVLDFGLMGIGDPTVDLVVAWNLLPAPGRAAFRDVLGVGDDDWARGRAWALSIALIQLPYYRDTNPVLVANSRHVIRQVLAEG